MPRINSSGWKSGDVKIHSGTLEDIPNGWELAQDMVDRAVVGAGNLYSKGQQFGADTVATDQHTLVEGQMPTHRLTIPAGVDTGDSSRVATAYGNFARTRYTDYIGSSEPHDHGNVDTRQQSIAVIWIRKL